VAVPPIIFVVCLAAGVYASTRWLPDLAPGPVGGVAFFVVCGLLGASLAVFALNIYDLVETLAQRDFDDLGRSFLASGLASLLWQSGLLVAAAMAVYLLAPPASDQEDRARPDSPSAAAGTPRP
jgi:hypothetical protein